MSRFKKTISLILVNMSLFGCHFQKENTESKAHSDSVETSGNLKDMVGEKLKQKINQKEENKKEIEEKERKEDREKKKDKNKSEKKEKKESLSKDSDVDFSQFEGIWIKNQKNENYVAKEVIEIKKDYFSWGILETDDMIIGSILDYKVENQTVTFYVFVPSDEFRGTTETIMTWNMEYRLNDNSLQLKDQENWLTLAEETSFVDTPIYSSFLETHMKFRSFLNENAPRIKQIERDFPTYSSYEEAHAIFRENIADHHDKAIANGEESDITEYMKDESSGIHFRPNGRPFYMFRYVVGQNEVITYLVYADNKEVLKLQGKVYPTLTDSDESE